MTITVHTPFVLTTDDWRSRQFDRGEHEVSDAIASHWYVRAHAVVTTPQATTPVALSEPSAALRNEAPAAPAAELELAEGYVANRSVAEQTMNDFRFVDAEIENTPKPARKGKRK